MKARCYAPSQTKGYYKQNHIQVCDRWRNSFDAFIADMGKMPNDSYSIERIDVTKDYEPSNCIWIQQTNQPKNRTNTIMVEIDGQRLCLKDVARKIGVKYNTLYMAYRRSGCDLKAIREFYGV